MSFKLLFQTERGFEFAIKSIFNQCIYVESSANPGISNLNEASFKEIQPHGMINPSSMFERCSRQLSKSDQDAEAHRIGRKSFE